MIVLDTDVISETSKPAPNPDLVGWLSSMSPDGLYLTQVTISELFYGGERYRLKTESSRYLNNATRHVEQDYAGRILR